MLYALKKLFITNYLHIEKFNREVNNINFSIDHFDNCLNTILLYINNNKAQVYTTLVLQQLDWSFALWDQFLYDFSANSHVTQLDKYSQHYDGLFCLIFAQIVSLELNIVTNNIHNSPITIFKPNNRAITTSLTNSYNSDNTRLFFNGQSNSNSNSSSSSTRANYSTRQEQLVPHLVIIRMNDTPLYHALSTTVFGLRFDLSRCLLVAVRLFNSYLAPSELSNSQVAVITVSQNDGAAHILTHNTITNNVTNSNNNSSSDNNNDNANSDGPETSISAITDQSSSQGTAELNQLMRQPGYSLKLLDKIGYAGLAPIVTPNDSMSCLTAVSLGLTMLCTTDGFILPYNSHLRTRQITVIEVMHQINELLNHYTSLDWANLLSAETGTFDVTWADFTRIFDNNNNATTHPKIKLTYKLILKLIAFIYNTRFVILHDNESFSKTVISPDSISRFINSGFNDIELNAPLIYFIEECGSGTLTPLKHNVKYVGRFNAFDERDFAFQRFHCILSSLGLSLVVPEVISAQPTSLLECITHQVNHFRKPTSQLTVLNSQLFLNSDIMELIIATLNEHTDHYRSCFDNFTVRINPIGTFHDWSVGVHDGSSCNTELFFHLVAHSLRCQFRVISHYMGTPNATANVINVYLPLFGDAASLLTSQLTITVVHNKGCVHHNNFYSTLPTHPMSIQNPPRDYVFNYISLFFQPLAHLPPSTWISDPLGVTLHFTDPLTYHLLYDSHPYDQSNSRAQIEHDGNITFYDLMAFNDHSSRLRGNACVTGNALLSFASCDQMARVFASAVNNLNVNRGPNNEYPKAPAQFFREQIKRVGPIDFSDNNNTSYIKEDDSVYATVLTTLAWREKRIISVIRHLFHVTQIISNHEPNGPALPPIADIISPHVLFDFPSIHSVIVDLTAKISYEYLNHHDTNNSSYVSNIRIHTTKMINTIRFLITLYARSRFQHIPQETILHYCYISFIGCFDDTPTNGAFIYPRVLKVWHYVSTMMNNRIVENISNTKPTGVLRIDEKIFRVSPLCVPLPGKFWRLTFSQHRQNIAHGYNVTKSYHDLLYPSVNNQQSN